MSEVYHILLREEETNESTGQIEVLHTSITFVEKKDNTLWDVFTRKDKLITIVNNDICKTLESHENYRFYLQDPIDGISYSFIAEKTNQKVGAYYPRIFKPTLSRHFSLRNGNLEEQIFFGHTKSPIDEKNLINSITQLTTLTKNLESILHTVYPSEANKNVFGFEIRNLLLLVCSEFESQIKGILSVNGNSPNGSFYTTRDYVKLLPVLKLTEYAIKFNHFPELPYFEPFKHWNNDKPTESLEWYDNYNAVKHDRENSFHKGTLFDVLNGLAACYIMLYAQYGNLPIINSRLGDFVFPINFPVWNPDEKLIKPQNDDDWYEDQYSC